MVEGGVCVGGDNAMTHTDGKPASSFVFGRTTTSSDGERRPCPLYSRRAILCVAMYVRRRRGI